jgi:hypothetical protein
MAKPTSLLDAVREHVVDRSGSWFDRMPAEAREELLSVRESFRRGELGKFPYKVAGGLRKAIEARGWPLPGEKGIAEWLKETD